MAQSLKNKIKKNFYFFRNYKSMISFLFEFEPNVNEKKRPKNK